LKINSAAFDKIHDLVGQKHFLGLTKQERRQKTGMSQDLWGVVRDGVLLISDAITPYSTAFNIIKTERTRIRKDTVLNKVAEIDPTFVISLLKFLDFNIENPTLDRDIITLTNKEAELAAGMLFGKFVRDKYPSYFKDFPQLADYFNDSLKINLNDDKLNLPQDDEIGMKNSHQSSKSESNILYEREFHKFIKTYFYLIEKNDYLMAFDFWWPASRDAFYNDNIRLFEKHFYNGFGYKNFHVFHLETTDTLSGGPYTAWGRCNVFFSETLKIPVWAIISQLSEVHFNNYLQLQHDLHLIALRSSLKIAHTVIEIMKQITGSATELQIQTIKDELLSILPEWIDFPLERLYRVFAFKDPVRGWRIQEISEIVRGPRLFLDPYGLNEGERRGLNSSYDPK
jgi:hypothetical protein